MEMTRMFPAEGDPGWWGYAEKDLWRDFTKAHPEWEKSISRLVSTIHFSSETCSDPVLTGGVQYEGLCLRVAELLGLHPPVDRTWPD
jgi:hypothetical protein